MYFVPHLLLDSLCESEMYVTLQFVCPASELLSRNVTSALPSTASMALPLSVFALAIVQGQATTPAAQCNSTAGFQWVSLVLLLELPRHLSVSPTMLMIKILAP